VERYTLHHHGIHFGRGLEKLLSDLKKIEETKPELHKRTKSEWKNSIAVLPFKNMSADPEQEYFCEGLSEELINALTQIKDLMVGCPR